MAPKLTASWLVFLFFAAVTASAATVARVQVAADQAAFVLVPSQRSFHPWGFNYDHDESGRLIEDYWQKDWNKVADDFREMKDLGANVVRVHLQLGRFMLNARKADPRQLRQLRRLLKLAETLQIYLDLTGLGSYHKQDVPPWYDALPEERRWDVQARFWQAIAAECKRSPAIFCYDLMNEPVVPADDGKRTDWLGPPFAGKYFVQWIALRRAGRSRAGIARDWINTLTRAIRSQDTNHLVTVGLVSWSLDRPGLSSGFDPGQICSGLDFISVHLYPEALKLEQNIETLRGFAVGKPVLIEETFPLRCSSQEFARFMDQTRSIASGSLGFYWGKTPAECRRSDKITDALTLQWLEFFQRWRPSGN